MRKIEKIMLAIPNCTWFNPRPWRVPPYTLALLHAVIPDEYDVNILEPNIENLTMSQVAKRIEDFNPDLVGVSCMSLEYAESAHKMIEIVKKADPAIFTVLGGVYGTVAPEIALRDSNIDFLILGEGERRLPKLLSMLSQGNNDFREFDGIAYRQQEEIIINPIKSFIKDLDSLPFPTYDKVNFPAYSGRSDKFSNVLLPRYFPYAVTSTSRGCPFNCIYCSTRSIDGEKIRYKSPERVLEEIDWLVNDYGIKEIIFLDDNLILDRKRFVTISKGLIEKDYDLHWKSVNLATFLLDEELLELMKESKSYQIIIPIESGNQDVLDNILKKPLDLKKVWPLLKKAKSLGFEIAADFIIGIPGETWDQIRETMLFAEQIDIDMVSFHIATPLPKTELFNLAKRQGYLEKDFSFTKQKYFGFGQGCITTEEFRPEDLHVLRAFEWDRINFKTEEKRKKFAKMAGITLKDLAMWRKNTIQNAGLFFPKPC